MASRFKDFVVKYGPVAVGTQISVCALWFGATYGVVKSGLDYKYIATKVGLDPENEKMKTASDALIAYMIYKAMAPVRIPIILGAIPIVAKVIRYTPK